MKVSLDTDVIIHLYQAGKQGMLLSLFEEIYVYKYLVDEELYHKSRAIYNQLIADAREGIIMIISPKELMNEGIWVLFQSYIEDYRNLFDNGEMYATALARAMGLFALVSDDTKEFGPHDTLVRELITDVMPFSFYELLFLRYINNELTVEQLHVEFDAISQRLEHPMSFESRMKRVLTRFNPKRGTERDWEWMKVYCHRVGTDFKEKVSELWGHLNRYQ